MNSSCLSKGGPWAVEAVHLSSNWELMIISDGQFMVTECHFNTVTLIKMFGGLDKITIAARLAFSFWCSSSPHRVHQEWTRDSGSIPRDSTTRTLTYFSFLFPTFRVASTALLFLSLFSFPCKKVNKSVNTRWLMRFLYIGCIVRNQPGEVLKGSQKCFLEMFYSNYWKFALNSEWLTLACLIIKLNTN